MCTRRMPGEEAGRQTQEEEDDDDDDRRIRGKKKKRIALQQSLPATEGGRRGSSKLPSFLPLQMGMGKKARLVLYVLTLTASA